MPASNPGVFLNGFYESWPIVYGESAYGFAKTGQTIVNATDAKIIRLYIDDEPWKFIRRACSSSDARSTGAPAPSIARSSGRLPPANTSQFRRAAWSR
jgi:Glycosyl hydrolase family 65, N-terminal domain